LLKAQVAKEKLGETRPENHHNDEQTVFQRGLSVLVVEDQLDSREALAEALESLGARVKTAASVKDALQCLETETPSLMISDIAMPQADGFELIRKVRERIPSEQMPAIAITGLSRLAEQEKALEAGFQGAFALPLRIRETTIGALNLFSADPTPMSEADLSPADRREGHTRVHGHVS